MATMTMGFSQFSLEEGFLPNQQNQQQPQYFQPFQQQLQQQYEIFSDPRSMEKVTKAFQGSSLRIKITEHNFPTPSLDIYSSSPSAVANFSLRESGASNSKPSSDDSSPEDESSPPKSPPTMCVSPEVRNRRNIIYMQSRIRNLKDKSFISPDRVFIREATFLKDKLFFLFNDILVITKLLQKEAGSEVDSNENLDYNSLSSSGNSSSGLPKISTPTPTQVKFRRSLDLLYLKAKALPDVSNLPKGQNLLQLKYNKKENGKRIKFSKTYAAPTKNQRDSWFIEICSLQDKLEPYSTDSPSPFPSYS